MEVTFSSLTNGHQRILDDLRRESKSYSQKDTEGVQARTIHAGQLVLVFNHWSDPPTNRYLKTTFCLSFQSLIIPTPQCFFFLIQGEKQNSFYSVFIRSDVIRSDIIRSVIIRSVGESKNWTKMTTQKILMSTYCILKFICSNIDME
jgi:hypothetical protein